MAKRIIRIGFDARLAGAAHAGIGRYSEELLRELLALSPENIQWVVFLSAPDQLSWLTSFSQVETRLSTIQHYTWQEQIWWLAQLYQAKLDVLHVPHFNVPVGYFRPFVVTIHDLLWHTQRDPRATTLSPLMYRLKYWGYRLVSWSAIKRAEIIFVPTQYVKKQIQIIIGRSAPVIVTSEGVGRQFQAIEPVGKQKRASKKKERAPYVLYTGSLYPHKNVEVILRSLRMLPKIHLVIVTARSVFLSSFLDTVQQMGLESQVSFYHQVTDVELIGLYQDAIALVQPSTAEGFGLTGIEAFSTGCPVICSDIEVFHEVYGKMALYFSPQDEEELQKHILTLQREPPSIGTRQKFQSYGKSFSWKKAALETWKGFLTVFNAKL